MSQLFWTTFAVFRNLFSGIGVSTKPHFSFSQSLFYDVQFCNFVSRSSLLHFFIPFVPTHTVPIFLSPTSSLGLSPQSTPGASFSTISNGDIYNHNHGYFLCTNCQFFPMWFRMVLKLLQIFHDGDGGGEDVQSANTRNVTQLQGFWECKSLCTTRLWNAMGRNTSTISTTRIHGGRHWSPHCC